MLLSLASATRLRYQADVYDVHRQWALLRYLGVFEEVVSAGSSWLGLSDAGRRVAGNQRRILSEDLGVGFATLLCGRWHLLGADVAPVSVRLADVDTVLAGSWRSRKIRRVGSLRPDYVVIAEGPASEIAIGLLECKGASDRRNALDQLARASKQLAGLLIDGAEVPGLAVGTELANRVIRCRAVQRLPRCQGHHHSVGNDRRMTPERLARSARVDATAVIPTFESPWDAAFDTGPNETGIAALALRALAASWASLAELCANEEAARRWRPGGDEVRQVGVSRPRGTYQAPDGRQVRGVANLLDLPGGRLEVVLGALAEVDDALASGDSAEILRAQALANAEGRTDLSEAGRGKDVSADGEVAAYGADGSALLLRPLAD